MSDVVQKIVKTPNPCELGLSVEVRDSLLANNPSLWPSATGTIPYSDFSSRLGELVQLDQAYAKGYGDYVFTMGESGMAGQETVDGIPTTVMYFAKAKTDAERNTPFKTWFTKKDWTWHEVLDGVEVVYDGQIADSPRYYPKYFGLAEYVGPCVFKIEQFLSEVPWNDTAFQATAPQPEDVDVWIMTPTGALHIDKRRVLHPLLKFKNPASTKQGTFFRTGVIPQFATSSGTFTFQPTNPPGRLAYIQSDSQDPVQGQWLRERATIYPPRIVKPLT